MKNQKTVEQFHHDKFSHFFKQNKSLHESKQVKTMKTQPSSYQHIASMTSQKNLSLNSSFNGLQSKPYIPINNATYRNTMQNNPEFGALRKKLIAANSKMLNSQPIQTLVKKQVPNLFISERYIASPPKLNHSLNTSAKINRSISENLSIKQPPRVWFIILYLNSFITWWINFSEIRIKTLKESKIKVLTFLEPLLVCLPYQKNQINRKKTLKNKLLYICSIKLRKRQRKKIRPMSNS